MLSLLLKEVCPLNFWWCSYSGSCLLPSSSSSKAPVTKRGYQIPGLHYLSCWMAQDQRSRVWPSAMGCHASSSSSLVSVLQDKPWGCTALVCIITGNTSPHPDRMHNLPKPLPTISTIWFSTCYHPCLQPWQKIKLNICSICFWSFKLQLLTKGQKVCPGFPQPEAFSSRICHLLQISGPYLSCSPENHTQAWQDHLRFQKSRGLYRSFIGYPYVKNKARSVKVMWH